MLTRVPTEDIHVDRCPRHGGCLGKKQPRESGPQELSVILVCVRNIPGKKNGPDLKPSSENSHRSHFKAGLCWSLSSPRQPFVFIMKINLFPGAPLIGSIDPPLMAMPSNACCCGFSRTLCSAASHPPAQPGRGAQNNTWDRKIPCQGRRLDSLGFVSRSTVL